MFRRSCSMSGRSQAQEAQAGRRGVCIRVARARQAGALGAVLFLGGVMAADAGAAVGDLTQKRGAAGCISATGSDGCSTGSALGNARSVSVSPDGKNTYVASSSSHAVAVFDRAADGTLTQKLGTAGCISQNGSEGCATGRALFGAFSVTVSPDGSSAYVASADGDAVVVFDRAVDGTLTQKPATAACVARSGSGGCAAGRAVSGARSVSVSPDGKNT